jgi:Na+/proline symporter
VYSVSLREILPDASVDWLILAAYCALLIAVALYFRKRAAHSVYYFLADRNLPGG